MKENPDTKINKDTAAEKNKGPMIDKAPKKHRRLRTRWILSFVAFFILAGILYLLYWLFIGQFYESTDNAYVNGNLVQVMPQITGHVTAILAEETDLVTKGQPLIVLDKADAEIALKNAETALAVTVRQVSQYYQNVGQLRANVEVQQQNLIKAQEDLKRRRGLIVNESISREDLRHAEIQADSAAAALNLSKHQLDAAINLVANSDLFHHPQIQQAEVNLRNAFLTFQRTAIYAPETGYVAKRPVQVGQQVDPSTVLMIIVPLNQIWVDANFKESQLKNIRIGQSARLISDLYGRGIKYQGNVVGLSPGTGSTFDLLPPQNATGNWIKIVQRLPVRISIDPKQLQKHPLRLGLSMTVRVSTHDRSGPVLSLVPEKRIVFETENFSSNIKGADQIIDQILQQNARTNYPAP